MGGDDAERPGFGQRLEDRAAEGGAFGGIGARSQLIQEDEALRGCIPERLAEPPHVRREGREVLLDRLLVPDVGDHERKEAEDGALAGRHPEPRHPHQGEETEGLERHRLPTHVRSGDDEEPGFAAELEVERHHFLGPRRAGEREQRMAAGAHGDRPAGAELGEDAVPIAIETRRRLDPIQAGELGRGPGKHRRLAAHLGGKRGEDAPHLGPLGLLGLAEPVSELDDLERLHEHGAARGRPVVDHAAHASQPIDGNGHRPAAGALGGERLAADARRQPFEPFSYLVARGRDAAAKLLQLRAGAIAHFTALIDRAPDRRLERGETSEL